MLRDPYQVLGVSKDAGEAEIKTAYRSLAKRYHPDMFPGDQATLEKFRLISEAYDAVRILSRKAPSPQRLKRRTRRREAEAFRRPRPAADAQHDETTVKVATGNGSSAQSTFDEGAAKAVKSGIKSTDKETSEKHGVDVLYQLDLSFEEACLGTTKRVKLPNGRIFDVTIPGGVCQDQQIRLPIDGGDPAQDNPSNDVIAGINIKDHPHFQRHGANVHLELPVTLVEAVTGAKIRIPTIDKSIMLAIPPGSNGDTIFRLSGRGAVVQGLTQSGDPIRGDQYVSLKIVLPETTDQSFAKLVKKWSIRNSYSARDHLDAFSDLN